MVRFCCRLLKNYGNKDTGFLRFLESGVQDFKGAADPLNYSVRVLILSLLLQCVTVLLEYFN